MRPKVLLVALGGGTALAAAFTAGALTAQSAPESILPPGYDDPAPAPAPAPTPAPAPAPSAGRSGSQGSSVSSAGSSSSGSSAGSGGGSATSSPRPLGRIPSVSELENMSIDELDDFLGLKPRYDMPPAARRQMTQVGVLASSEGGLPVGALQQQPAGLVRAVLNGTEGPLVSRWGHIVLRRVLASRMSAPDGMDPVEFTALRAKVLNNIGEFPNTRALVQDVDTGNWDEALTDEALKAYVASADFVGACPAVKFQGSKREDPQWVMWQAICHAYAGESALAGSQLDKAIADEIAPEIDVLLAQRIAGAAGRSRRGTEVEWEGVEELSPWRFALANAVGEEIPEQLSNELSEYYQLSAATAPMIGLEQRARYADQAARRGILSSRAMVDLYSQIYADDAVMGEISSRAGRLRNAYVASDPAARVAAMRGLWETLDGDRDRPLYSGSVMTAYAAARIPPSASLERHSGELIASMLTAGLEKDAASWSNVVEQGSLGWALITLASADARGPVTDGVDSFIGDDDSEEYRKSAFLVAGLAGLGRINRSEFAEFGSALDFDTSRQTRWTRTIARAAQVDNQALVALLAGLGMQGQSWKQMTPLHLYHIVSAMQQVGLEAEARMIAAEAVARG